MGSRSIFGQFYIFFLNCVTHIEYKIANLITLQVHTNVLIMHECWQILVCPSTSSLTCRPWRKLTKLAILLYCQKVTYMFQILQSCLILLKSELKSLLDLFTGHTSGAILVFECFIWIENIDLYDRCIIYII